MVSASSVTSADVGRFIFIDTPKPRSVRGRRAGHDLVHRPRRLPDLERLLRGQSAQNQWPGRLDGGRSHPEIMTNCSTRVELNNYKASYLRCDERCRDLGNRDHVPRAFAEPPEMVSVGTIVWLSSELMFFAGLFAMYFTAPLAGRWRVAPTADRN
jgi:hypothetical protein